VPGPLQVDRGKIAGHLGREQPVIETLIELLGEAMDPVAMDKELSASAFSGHPICGKAGSRNNGFNEVCIPGEIGFLMGAPMEVAQRAVPVDVVVLASTVERMTELLLDASNVVPRILVILDEEGEVRKPVVVVEDVPKVGRRFVPLVHGDIEEVVRILLVVHENIDFSDVQKRIDPGHRLPPPTHHDMNHFHTGDQCV
jgi:hypothetical protein